MLVVVCTSERATSVGPPAPAYAACYSPATEVAGVQTVEWGLNMLPGGGHRLREAERAAKQGKIGELSLVLASCCGTA